jgi:hypothetical protein
MKDLTLLMQIAAKCDDERTDPSLGNIHQARDKA